MSMLGRRLSHKNQYEKNQFSSNTLRLHEGGKIFTLNYRWIFASAISVVVGLFTLYTSMHYITAFVSPHQFLWASDSNSAANQLEHDSIGIIEGFVDSFTRDQAYIRAGKGIEVHYIMPEGKTIELTIIRCQGVFIVEVFDCTPDTAQKITLDGALSGVERYIFGDKGFYVYDSELINADGSTAVDKSGYRVVWRRA